MTDGRTEGKRDWLAPGVILAVVVLASVSLHWRINDVDKRLDRLDTRLGDRLERVEARLNERMVETGDRVKNIETALAENPVFLLRPQLTTTGVQYRLVPAPSLRVPASETTQE